jgi:hypothetical protein
MAFDENKYKQIFEDRFGPGSFESGLANARKMGQLKAQAKIAKSSYDNYVSEQKKAQKAAETKAKKKTYTDALSYFNDPSVKNAIKKDGAYKIANDIKNDPQKQADIKAQGFSVDDYINAMYSATSDGKFRSQREYSQYQSDLTKQTKAEYKKKDEETKAKTGMTYQEYSDYQNNLKKAQSQTTKKKSTSKNKDSIWSDLKSGIGKALEIVDRPGDAVRTGIKEKVDGGSFWQGAKDGFTGKKDTSGTELNKSLGFDPTTDSKDKKIANSIGKIAMAAGPTKLITPFLSKQVKEKAATQAGTVLPGMGSEILLDPLNLVGAGVGKGATKGLQIASEQTMKNLLPRVDTALMDGAKAFKAEQALPIRGGVQNPGMVQDLIPRGSEITKPNYLPSLTPKVTPQVTVPKIGTPLQEGLDGFRQAEQHPLAINPEPLPTTTNASPMSQEFKDAVQSQYEYLKNSMGKGVDYGTTGTGLGNFREVNGSFSVSRNPQWYQDFYKQYGRKPNNQELMQLAEQHVREGFQDELGSLPAWQPEEVQAIDDQINEIQSLIQQNPEQEAVLKPILDGLQEDRALALKKMKISPQVL